jgi:hypothetical protein
MVDDIYNDKLWYANLRVTKETFTFILGKIEHDIHHKNTHLREAISAKRRLAITLYFLASTAEIVRFETYLECQGHLYVNAFRKYVVQ